MKNAGWLAFGVLLGGLLTAASAQAADFTGAATENSTVLLGVGVAVCFALGWIAGGQR